MSKIYPSTPVPKADKILLGVGIHLPKSTSDQRYLIDLEAAKNVNGDARDVTPRTKDKSTHTKRG